MRRQSVWHVASTLQSEHASAQAAGAYQPRTTAGCTRVGGGHQRRCGWQPELDQVACEERFKEHSSAAVTMRNDYALWTHITPHSQLGSAGETHVPEG